VKLDIFSFYPKYKQLMRRLILLILPFICFFARAQNIIPRFETLGVNEGLSQSSVYSIYQDKKGFMWFGTADGLNRYDGKNIKIYKINDEKKSNLNAIRGKLCEDRLGRIWFCNETGIFFYDPVTDSLICKVTFSMNQQTLGLFIDKQNVFYFIHTGTGIYAYDIAADKLTLTHCRFKISGISFSDVSVTNNQKNLIWIPATNAKANVIFTFNTQTNKVSSVSTGGLISSVFYGGNGRLYHIILPGKLLVTDTAMHKLYEVNYPLSKNKMLDVQSVYADAYHRVWLATIDNGLLCYNETTKTFASYIHDNSKQRSLSINILSSLYIDGAENMWIGTDGGGVCKLDLKPPKFNLFPLNEGDHPFLKDYFTRCFYEDEKGNIWFGTHSSGLNKLDPLTGSIKNYNYHQGVKNGLPGPVIGAIFKDKQGKVWVAYSTGVAIFNERHNSFTPIKIIGGPALNEHTNFIYKIIQQQNGEMIAATFGGLMVIKKAGGMYVGVFGKSKSETNILVTDILEMPDHTFWATSPVKGLMHYRKNGNEFIIIERKFPFVDLRSVHLDEENHHILWIGTGTGLVQFNTLSGANLRYDERQGMANSYVYGLLEDEQHNFWISTNKGICFFNRKNHSFQNYNAKDGLQSNEFNTQAFYKGQSGVLYFGGIKGFNWFIPSQVKVSSTNAPGVAITMVSVDDQPYVKDTTFVKKHLMVLPYNQNNISFHFAALDYTKPEANRVKFILQGWDKNWITSVDEIIRYAHLGPGKYLLRVKAANSYGIWSNEERLTIVIKTPFWQTISFYIISCIIFLGAIIYCTYLFSQQKIKKQLRGFEKQQAINAERNRISRDMHDEIGSGLTHIALLSELVGTQHKTNQAIKNDVGSIAISARQLVTSMSEIIWALNPQNDDVADLLSYTREQMQHTFLPFGITLVIDFPEQLPQLKLSNEQRRNLYLVTKEALNNVLKHSGATNVRLSAGFSGDELKMSVCDNGKGLADTPIKTNGNGLKNMRKRMEDVGGSIDWINSKPGLCVNFALKAKV
jgi:signal transduction histidine kinase/ligand-binding sensor domain-containing protein